MARFFITIVVVGRLAEVDDAATVVGHLPRELDDVGMLAQVLLKEPHGIHPIEYQEHHQNYSYAYQQFLHG